MQCGSSHAAHRVVFQSLIFALGELFVKDRNTSRNFFLRSFVGDHGQRFAIGVGRDFCLRKFCGKYLYSQGVLLNLNRIGFGNCRRGLRRGKVNSFEYFCKFRVLCFRCPNEQFGFVSAIDQLDRRQTLRQLGQCQGGATRQLILRKRIDLQSAIVRFRQQAEQLRQHRFDRRDIVCIAQHHQLSAIRSQPRVGSRNNLLGSSQPCSVGHTVQCKRSQLHGVG